ncbi:hypothetical protein SDC9_160477 [bioreactor metagenome]|uniref:Uncharacterized protein n=1 Tax=bioreactor metagenome TaxID=1076179 RepID=A0A645FFQ2_9ZZZZ
MCTSSGGKRPERASARCRLAPSRTSPLAVASARRSGSSQSTAQPASRAASSGTPLATRMAMVCARRALSSACSRRPRTGRRSSCNWRAWRKSSLRQARRKAHRPPPKTTASSGQVVRRRSLTAISARVRKGSVCLPLLKTATTCGTT